MTFAKRSLVVLALAASVSYSASAFNPGAFVKNAAGNALAGKRQFPIANRYVDPIEILFTRTRSIH